MTRTLARPVGGQRLRNWWLRLCCVVLRHRWQCGSVTAFGTVVVGQCRRCKVRRGWGWR